MLRGILSPSAQDSRPGATGVRAVLCVGIFSLLLSACLPATPADTPTRPPTPAVPSVTEGSISGSEAREAQRLLTEARSSLEGGNRDLAAFKADSVLALYPQADGSAEALGILARARAGQGRYGEASEAAGRYARLLGTGHPYFPEAVLLEARALAAAGRSRDAVEALLALPGGSPAGVVEAGRGIFRESVASLTHSQLLTAAQDAAADFPLRGELATELAVSLYRQGDLEEADRWARSTLDLQLEARERELVQAVMDRRLEEVLGLPVILGAILPRSGVSPGLLEYGEWVQEGIQVAIEEFRSELRRPVQLEVSDTRGTTLGGRTSMRTLQDFGALGGVGPLTQEVLAEAAATREGFFPLISPFSFLSPDEAPGVYSLSGPDPSGARALADYAWELGLERVVVVRPATEAAAVDAEAFQEAFRAVGGLVPREIVFDSGATFFQPQFEEVSSILPDGLFLPLNPRDIELLAPQVTYYGLDTLGIQLLGTAGWARDEVVVEVDSRHTDGVIAATTRTTQDETEEFVAFREAYEELFQKTLRSEVPAFGYDAAGLFLKALEAGPRSSQELQEALEGIRDFPGATGRLTIERGRIMREPHLVRIQDHELIYISSRYD